MKGRLIKNNKVRYNEDGKSFAIKKIDLSALPSVRPVASSDQTFTFLNLHKKFSNSIRWGFNDYGKLWNYNLQYCAFINQEDLGEDLRVSWLRSLYCELNLKNIDVEPYPLSLRCLNVMRFLDRELGRKDKFPDILGNVHVELEWLHHNYEYHLLGNHLLENLFAMLMGSHVFGRTDWEEKATIKLRMQMEEQILCDGGHFELSPMYHQIILFRVLEAIDYLPEESSLSDFLKKKAVKMLGWLKNMTFVDGSVPHFNDSTNEIAFTSNELFRFAHELNLIDEPVILKESGFRKFANSRFELVTDVHGISPSYQPGHNHSDHLSFVLYADQKPFIVDPGTSTYNIGDRRNWERSSKAHNTVTMNDRDQSEVWGGFRVGRRARVRVTKESPTSVEAYAKYREICHIRKFEITDEKIEISDLIEPGSIAVGRIYLHPSIRILSNSAHQVTFSNGYLIVYNDALKVEIGGYQWSESFNNLKKGQFISAYFKGSMISKIQRN